MAPVTNAPITQAEMSVDRRKQLLQKLQQQAQNHLQFNTLRGRVGASPLSAGTIGMARSGARAPMVHGLSIANFLKSRLGVQGGFAPGTPASNIAPADTAPAAPPPPPGSSTPPPLSAIAPAPAPAPASSITPSIGTPIAAGAAPAGSPQLGAPVPDSQPYAPTAQDNAIQGQTTTMWSNEAALSNGLIPLGNGMFIDPATNTIVGGPAPTLGSGPLGHGAVL